MWQKHINSKISNLSFVEAIPCNDRIKKRAKRRGILATPRITEWLWSCPLNAHIPMPSPCTPCLPTSDSKNNKKRRRSNKKRKDASRQPAPTFQLDPADTSPIPIPSHEDSSAGRHSIMSPELRSRPTQWNHAASKQTKAADNLSKERGDDWQFLDSFFSLWQVEAEEEVYVLLKNLEIYSSHNFYCVISVPLPTHS